MKKPEPQKNVIRGIGKDSKGTGLDPSFDRILGRALHAALWIDCPHLIRAAEGSSTCIPASAARASLASRRAKHEKVFNKFGRELLRAAASEIRGLTLSARREKVL